MSILLDAQAPGATLLAQRLPRLLGAEVVTAADVGEWCSQREADPIAIAVVSADTLRAVGAAACDEGRALAPLFVVLAQDDPLDVLWALRCGAWEALVEGPGLADELAARLSEVQQVPPLDRLYHERSALLPDPILLYGADRRLLAVNRAGLRWLGRGRDEALGLRDEDVFPREEVGALIALHLRAPEVPGHALRMQTEPLALSYATGRQTVALDVREVTEPGGSRRELLVRHRVVDEDEANWEAGRSPLHSAFQSLPFDVWLVDREGRITLQNARSVQSWGPRVGHRLRDLEPEEGVRERWQRALDRVLAGHLVQGDDLLRLPGRERTFWTVMAPVERKGRVGGALGLHLDVSDARRFEEERNDFFERLRHAQKLEVVGQLASGISHDLNNILTVILGGVEQARSGVMTPDDLRAVSQGLDAVEDATRRAVALNTYLIGLSRRRVGANQVDISRALPELERLLGSLVREDIHLATYVMAGTRGIRLSQVQIEQILINLVINARDAMPDGGKLMVKAWNARREDLEVAESAGIRLGQAVVLSVRDTGVGIPEEDQPKIFEHFFTTKPPGQGTGLGLAIVRSIVADAGGFVHVDSEVGKGTCFRVILPACELPSREAAPTATVLRESGSGRTVLVCEDDAAVCAVISRYLEDGGYRVLQEVDPLRALRRAEEILPQIDLLLTDVVMPAMSGQDLASQLRTRRPSLPVLFVSGHADEQEIHPEDPADEEAGFAFLPKPFDRTTLTAQVQALLDRSFGRYPPRAAGA